MSRRVLERRLPCGAMLTAEEHWQYAGILSSGHREVTCMLHDLPVAPGDAERLASARAGWTSWISFTVMYPDGDAAPRRPVSCLSRIQVTPQEADRMLSGEHPMTVLLPRIWARPLTLEEMTGA